MKRQDMRCETCIYHTETPELWEDGQIECRLNNEFRWKPVDAWCGEGAWHEWRESQFPSLAGPKIRFEISWGDWDEETPSLQPFALDWTHDGKDHFLIRNGLVVARVSYYLDDHRWIGHLQGLASDISDPTLEGCKVKAERYFADEESLS